MPPRQQIAQIDKEIDANRRNPKSPERTARENALFLQRGIAQLERDQQAHAAAMKLARSKRVKPAKKCPTCGFKTLLAA